MLSLLVIMTFKQLCHRDGSFDNYWRQSAAPETEIVPGDREPSPVSGYACFTGGYAAYDTMS